MKLIKKIGFVLVAALLAMEVSAQEGSFRLSFQFTPGVSWMTTDKSSVSKVGSNATIGVGPVGEFGVSDHLYITGGIGLSFNRGGALRHATGGNFFPESRLSDDAYNSGQKPLPDGTRLKYMLQYAEVPMGLKWKVEVSDHTSLYAEAPTMTWAFTVQRRGSIKAGDINTSKENISKDVEPFNLSVGFGAGMEYAFREKTALIAGFSFQRGLLDATSDKANTATPNPNDNPFDPNDDYIEHAEDAHAVISALVLRIGILF